VVRRCSDLLMQPGKIDGNNGNDPPESFGYLRALMLSGAEIDEPVLLFHHQLPSIETTGCELLTE
jgi:hypothetical protein